MSASVDKYLYRVVLHVVPRGYRAHDKVAKHVLAENVRVAASHAHVLAYAQGYRVLATAHVKYIGPKRYDACTGKRLLVPHGST